MPKKQPAQKTLAQMDEFEFDVDLDQLTKPVLLKLAQHLRLDPLTTSPADDLKMLIADSDEDDCAIRDALYAQGIDDSHPCFSIVQPKPKRKAKPKAEPAPKAAPKPAKAKPAQPAPKAKAKPAKAVKEAKPEQDDPATAKGQGAIEF